MTLPCLLLSFPDYFGLPWLFCLPLSLSLSLSLSVGGCFFFCFIGFSSLLFIFPLHSFPTYFFATISANLHSLLVPSHLSYRVGVLLLLLLLLFPDVFLLTTTIANNYNYRDRNKLKLRWTSRWKLKWKLKWEYLLLILLFSNSSVVLGQVPHSIIYNNNNIYNNNRLMLIKKIFNFTGNDVDGENHCDHENNQDHTINHVNYDISMMILQSWNHDFDTHYDQNYDRDDDSNYDYDTTQICLNKKPSTVQYLKHRNIPYTYIVQDTIQMSSNGEPCTVQYSKSCNYDQNYDQDDNQDHTINNFGTHYVQNMVPKSLNCILDDDFDTHYDQNMVPINEFGTIKSRTAQN